MDKSPTRTVIERTIVGALALAFLLFVPAGTLRWVAGWVFLVELMTISLATGLWLARHDPELLAERLKPVVQRDQPQGDRVIMRIFLVIQFLALPLMVLDAVRFHFSHVPSALQGAGAILIAAGFLLIWLTFRANTFTATVVKIQSERAHRVIDSGPYAFVRHPMYAGAFLLFLGVPLLLGSWLGLIFTAAFVVLLAIRTRLEERTLMEGLPGYRDYVQRVRARFIPYVW